MLKLNFFNPAANASYASMLFRLEHPLPPLQGALYVSVYTWLAIGIIGGWAAARTESIWPSLISATVCILVLVARIR